MTTFIVVEVNEAHVFVQVRCGDTPGNRPLNGELKFSHAEWGELASILRDVEQLDGRVRVEGG